MVEYFSKPQLRTQLQEYLTKKWKSLFRIEKIFFRFLKCEKNSFLQLNVYKSHTMLKYIKKPTFKKNSVLYDTFIALIVGIIECSSLNGTPCIQGVPKECHDISANDSTGHFK